MSNLEINSESEIDLNIVESTGFFEKLGAGLSTMFDMDEKAVAYDPSSSVQNDVLAGTVPIMNTSMNVPVTKGQIGGRYDDISYDEEKYHMYKDAYYILKDSLKR